MGNFDDLIEKVRSLRREKKLDDAEALVRTALEDDTKQWRLWSELGHTQVARGSFGEAADSFRYAIDLESKRSGLWNSLSYALKEAGDLDGAVDSVTNAKAHAKTDNEHKTADYNLACYLSLQGKLEEALKHLEMACNTDSSIREWAKSDSDLDPIRTDPRFSDIVGSEK